MIKITSIIISLALLSGCSATAPKWLIGSDNCRSIGCGKDLEFYPNAPGEASRNAKAHGWDWGKTSSAHRPGTPEYERLRKWEEESRQTPWHWNQPNQ